MVDVKKDLLEMFGLKEDFSKEELKNSYKRLVKIAHPDAGGDANLFKFITKYMEHLLDNKIGFEFEDDKSKKNQKYDNSKNYKGNYRRASRGIKFDLLDNYYSTNRLYELKKYELDEIYQDISLKFKTLAGINEKFVNLTLKTPYINFVGNDFVDFTSDVIIPKEFKKILFLRVKVSILDKNYNFIIFNFKKCSKVVEYKRLKHFRCLKLIVNLNFKNENSN